MFDAESARLIRLAPRVADIDPGTLPQALTRTYAQLVALRMRAADPEAAAAADERYEGLLRLAAVYEGVVDTTEDEGHRRGAAFVAATAYQILGRVADRDDSDAPLLTPDAIHPRVAAPLLFIIAGQSPDAREAGGRLAILRDGPVLIGALIESVADLARENLVAILNRAERLAERRPDRGDLIGQTEQTLYGLCWAGLAQLAASVLARDAPQTLFRRFDTPEATFRQVEALSAMRPHLAREGIEIVNTYAGPRHLARLLQQASRQFMGFGLAGLPAPAGVAEEAWRPWLKRRAVNKPVIWPNHRAAIHTGLLERGVSGVLVLPTGAGKTTLSELKIAAALASGRKVIFLAPTLALVDQLRDEFARTFSSDLGQVVVSTDGDLSALVSGPSLSDIEVMTPERLLAMLSFADADLSDVGLIVFDECHLLAPRGGGTRSLDAMLCLLHAARRAPDADFLLLSAMLTNGDDLAEWLGELTGRQAVFFHDPWKPSRQARGVVVYPQDELNQFRRDVQNGMVPRPTYPAIPHALFGLQQNWIPAAGTDTAVVKLMDETVHLTTGAYGLQPTANTVAGALAERASQAGLKTIIFVQQADHAPSTARKISERLVGPWRMTETEQGFAADIAVELGTGKSLVQPQAGAVPHNGDMIPLERRLAESLYRREDGAAIIVATPTLAQGINLPAQVAILAGDKRSGADGERARLEQHELLNAAGRAGRAGFLANGMVLLVPEPVIGFTPEQPALAAYPKLLSILPNDDRCVLVEDPVEHMLDQIQLGQVSARIDYFVNRMRSGEPDEAGAVAVALTRRSFGAFLARKRGETIDAAVAALEQALAATPAEDDDTGSLVAALTGLPRDAVAVLAARLGTNPAAFPVTIPAWVSWIVEFFRREPEAAGHLVGGLDTIKAVTRGRKTGGPITDAEFDRLNLALQSWISGRPFSEIEQALGVAANAVKTCKRSRDLVLKVVGRNLYMVATAVSELAKRRLAQTAEGVVQIPAVIDILAYALRAGFDSAAKTAFHHLHKDIRTRVEAHTRFREFTGNGEIDDGGTFSEVFDRLQVRLLLLGFED
jgi:hypothetical protein